MTNIHLIKSSIGRGESESLKSTVKRPQHKLSAPPVHTKSFGSDKDLCEAIPPLPFQPALTMWAGG